MFYPSVTQILKPYSDFSRVKPATLIEASERGVRVHAACAAHALSLPIDDLFDDEQPYFESFKKWFDWAVKEVFAVETEYYDFIHGYKGHPDLVCFLRGDGIKSVIDYKTPIAFKKQWALQLAGYANLTGSERCMSLRLSPRGKRAIINENKYWQYDFSIFLNALAVWKYFNS